jgi:hypothetical protein
LLLALAPGVARAGAVDTWGYGARSMAEGAVGVALADGPEATFLNPAALSRQPAQRLILGYALQRADFREVPPVIWDTNQDGLLTDTDDPLQVDVDPDRADGFHVALGRPVGKRFGISLAAFLPVDRLLRIRTTEPALPTYFMYDNRPHRYELSLGFGWQQLPGLSVGGAVEMLAQARYRIQVELDVPVTGAEEGDQLGDLVGPLTLDVHEMVLDLAPSFAPVVGMHWDVGEAIPGLDGLMIGAVYRGSSGLPVDITVDLQGNIRVEDVGELEPVVVSLLVPISIDMFDHYVPERFSMGLGWQTERWELSAESSRTSWDRMRVNVSTVTGDDVQTEVLRLSEPTIGDGNGYQVTLRPTWSGRLGGGFDFRDIPLNDEWEVLSISLRAGALFEPSPLASQGTSSSFLDADRVGFTGGFGLQHGEPFGLVEGPIAWDAFIQLHMLASGALNVAQGASPRAGSPVGNAPIPVGGRLWAAGAQWSVDF